MEILYTICCGLDVHKDSITACLRRLGAAGHVTKELRSFGTTTGALLTLCDWLVAAGCTHVAMESTGQYWKPRKGNKWLRTALVAAAWAASHTRTYLGAQYHRLARRRGKKKAVVAVAHSILVIAYHILKEGTTYRELGHDYFDKRDSARLQRRLITRLESLGLRVTVEPLPQAP